MLVSCNMTHSANNNTQVRGDGTFEVDVVCGGPEGIRTDIVGGVSAAYSLSDPKGREDFMNLPKVSHHAQTHTSPTHYSNPVPRKGYEEREVHRPGRDGGGGIERLPCDARSGTAPSRLLPLRP